MPKARSPQYPAIGLKEAIEKVRAVYEQDYQNAIPRELVAEHIGYQSLHGKALGVLSALLKFGLLEGRGSDTRVSDLAVRIIAHPTGTSERAEAVAEAATMPDLFKEIDGRFPGKVSDQAIRSYLLTQKFIPNAADAVISAYRETKGLVEAESGSYDSGPEKEPSDGMTSTQTLDASLGRQGAPPLPPAAPSSDPYRVSFTPTGGLEVVARLQSTEDVDALVAAVNAWKVLFKKAADIQPPAGVEPGHS